jgi:hypothetical protein
VSETIPDTKFGVQLHECDRSVKKFKVRSASVIASTNPVVGTSKGHGPSCVVQEIHQKSSSEVVKQKNSIKVVRRMMRSRESPPITDVFCSNTCTDVGPDPVKSIVVDTPFRWIRSVVASNPGD